MTENLEPIDYDEEVTVLDQGPSGRSVSNLMTLGVGPHVLMPLKNAVRMIVIDWADDIERQLAAFILRDGEPAYTTFTEIRAVFYRPDFPLK